MFGFKRKGEIRKAEFAERLGVLNNVCYSAVLRNLTEVGESTVSNHRFEGAGQDVWAMIKDLKKGAEEVLMNGKCPFDEEIINGDNKLIYFGAQTAHTARNMAILTGEVDENEIRGDFYDSLGFARDGQKKDQSNVTLQSLEMSDAIKERVVHSVERTLDEIVSEWLEQHFKSNFELFVSDVASSTDPDLNTAVFLREFERSLDSVIEHIGVSLRQKTSNWAEMSDDLNIRDAFEALLNSRLSGVRAALIDTVEGGVQRALDEFGR